MKNIRLNHNNIIALIESSSNGNIWKVMVIETGLSKNGKFYTEQALRNAVSLFEKSKVCFYEWKDKHFDHIPMAIERIRPEGFPLQTAGFLENVKYETVKIEGRESTGLTAHLHLLDTKPVEKFKEMLVSAWKKGVKNIIGLSINAEGPSSVRMMNGVPVAFVTGIKRVFSTDFVTQPAAGGELLKIIESINEQEGGCLMNFKKLLEALKLWNSKLLEGVDIENITQEEVQGIFAKVLKEAEEKKSKNLDKIKKIEKDVKEGKFDAAEAGLGKLLHKEALSDEELLKTDNSELDEEQLAKKKELLAKKKEEGEGGKKEEGEGEGKALEAKKKAEDADAKAKALEAKIDAMEKKAKIRECKEMLQLALDESNLPEPVRAKIKRSFEGKIFTETKIKESIKDERDTLAKLVESGSNIDLGDIEGIFVERGSSDRLQCSLDLMIGYKPGDDDKNDYEGIDGFNSLKEAYIAYTDDPYVSGVIGPKAISRFREATEASFNYALGYSMQRRMLPDYKAVEPQWREIAVSVPIQDFKLQERIIWGGFGILPTVQAARTAAGTPIDTATPDYAELGFPTDEEATYAIATKGGMVTVTRRMIIDDDLKILQKISGKLGKAAALTLNRFVFDLMLNVSAGTINGGTIYDSIALYATAHKNYRTSAFSHDNLYDLLNDMYYQTELGYKTLAASGTDFDTNAAGTDLNVTAATGQYIHAGDRLWCEGEIMSVDSIGTDAIVVTRGLFGTTAVTHADGAAVYIITSFIGIDKVNLWVPRGLRAKAMTLKNSEKNPESAEEADNTVRELFEPKVTPHLRGDENNFYLSANIKDVEGIEVGFLNGKEDPEILIQDQPTVGNVFLYDTIRYKVRHEYGGAVVDYRAFAAGIVSG